MGCEVACRGSQTAFTQFLGGSTATGSGVRSAYEQHVQQCLISQSKTQTAPSAAREEQQRVRSSAEIDQAAVVVSSATDRQAVSSAVRSAMRALEQARRCRGSKAQLLTLERKMEALRRKADSKAEALTNAQTTTLLDHVSATLSRSCLDRNSLGVVPRKPAANTGPVPGSTPLPFGTILQSGLTVIDTVVLKVDQSMPYAELRPSTEYHFSGQTYVTDENGLPAYAFGELHLHPDSDSLRHPEGTKIGRLGLEGDVGGHLIGAQFGGFGSGPNLIPQNMKLNGNSRFEYGELENMWKTLLKKGARVHVEIRLQVESISRNRPEGIYARWRVDSQGTDVSAVLNGDPSGTFENYFANEAPI